MSLIVCSLAFVMIADTFFSTFLCCIFYLPCILCYLFSYFFSFVLIILIFLFLFHFTIWLYIAIIYFWWLSLKIHLAFLIFFKKIPLLSLLLNNIKILEYFSFNTLSLNVSIQSYFILSSSILGLSFLYSVCLYLLTWLTVSVHTIISCPTDLLGTFFFIYIYPPILWKLF